MSRNWPEIFCAASALAVALVAAGPYAEGFNDGSRLATIETLGERGTFAIDDSLFVAPRNAPDRANPYNPARPGVYAVGTLDKVRIDGRFYSDKPPLPALAQGALYRIWLRCGGAPASARIDLYCRACTFVGAGVCYWVAVLAMVRLARDLGFGDLGRFAFALSFGGCTLAPVYAGNLNGHIQLLAAAAVVCWQMVRLSEDPSRRRLWVLGTAAGIGATLDLGMGPILLIGVLAAIAGTTRSARKTASASAGAAPWLALHFALNYSLGGTFVPLGSVMEFLDYPHTAFGPHNATGTWKHGSAGAFAEYACDLLLSECGFLPFNPMLLLAVLAGLSPLRISLRRRVGWILAVAIGWPVLSWLLYAATSNNLSGACCSIRWFVPLLAPGYWLIGMLLRAAPRFWVDFLWLSAVGGVVVWNAFDLGPWQYRRAWDLFPLHALGGAGWLAIRLADRWKRC